MKNVLANCAIAFSALLVVSMAAANVYADPTSNPTVGVSSEATKDLIGTLEESGHFKTLVKAIEAAGLVETLKGKGPFTVFAPSDEAFAKLPAGTLDDLLKPEHKDKLKKLLLTHVVPGHLLIADVKKMKEASTSGGTMLKVTHHLLTGVHIGTAKEMVRVQNSDIHATNGVIHILDKVILP